MQRWALILSGYQYKIEYIPSKENTNADMLSRLPVDKPDSASLDEPICKDDTTLADVYDHTLHGWPRSCARDDELDPFFVRKEELSLENGCIVWGQDS